MDRAAVARFVWTESGPLQLSLFDERNLAEITAPGYPGQRPIVCRNPELARERARKRNELLAATERDLSRIVAHVRWRFGGFLLFGLVRLPAIIPLGALTTTTDTYIAGATAGRFSRHP
jgi:hypothetical protein